MRKETAAHTPSLSAALRISLIREMALEISPEPSDEERKAILEALAEEDAERAAPSPWRAEGLGSGGRAATPQPWGDAGVVEP